jgi:hypothetical protein
MTRVPGGRPTRAFGIESRRDGVKVAQDVSSWVDLDVIREESRKGRLNACLIHAGELCKFQPSLRDSSRLSNLPSTFVLGYFQPSRQAGTF